MAKAKRTTNEHRVIAKFPAAEDPDPALRAKATNGYYAWPVHGGDMRIDAGSGPDALRRIRISGVTLRWSNNGAPRHAQLTRRS